MLGDEEALLEYHTKLLGMPEPWKVAKVALDVPSRQVTIQVDYPEGTFAHCPECNNLHPVYDRRLKRWRHLAQMSFQTVLECRVPRIECEHHGILQVLVPWAEPHGRFTLEYEAFAILVIRNTRSLKEAANLLSISWDSVHHIQARAVWRGKQREAKKVMEKVGIDEKSFLSRHRYATVVSDIDGGRVIEVVQGRTEDAAVEALSSLTPEQRQGVKAVAADFLDAYANAAEKTLPNAILVHDRYHAMTYLTKAVDKVRKGEHRDLLSEGSEVLKKTKFLWLTNEVNWSEEQKVQYATLKGLNLKVGRAFAMKEQFRAFWKCRSRKEAETFYKWWHFWATHSRLKPMLDTAMTFRRHKEGIFAYFKHRITNAVAEGLNSKIQVIKSGARGFRNFANYRIAILFHCGGLDLSPHTCR